MALDLSRWSASLTAFCAWLESESVAAARKWASQLKSTDSSQVEAAVAEGVVWDFIGCRSEQARLVDAPGTGGVDFEFIVGQSSFLVEVTNISIESATDACKMPDRGLFKGVYGLLTARIRQKVRRKLEQAKEVQGADPLLVAVTTLHGNASTTCVDRRAVEFAMSSPPKITADWNPRTGMSEGEIYQSTDLKQSVFLSPTPILGPDGQPIAQAKYQPISGFVLAGFGVEPNAVRMYGGLNPEAVRPFDPKLLPDVPFCYFSEWPVSESIQLSWTMSEDEEETPRRQAAEKRLREAGLGGLVDEVREEIRRRSSK